jgi:peptidoglycan hydrolase-like protein with peptidoglycan-binding domain
VRRRSWALAAATVVAGAVLAGGLIVTSGPEQQAMAAQHSSVDTVTLERRELSAMVSEDAILTYRAQPDGSPYAVINQAQGTYTALPTLGEVISEGHVLYRVNDRPVVLLRGLTPAFRTLSVGARGPDVTELNADLVALGYATPSQLSPSSSLFVSATARAVARLQDAVGLTHNGTLTLGQAVFEPAAIRVTTVLAQLGGNTQIGQTVLEGTSTTRQVQVALEASQQSTMAVGDKVTITLPNNQTTAGVVSSVGAVATCPSSSGPGGSGSSSAAPGTDACSAGSSGSTPTVSVGITPSDPAATGTWDQAPVQVAITTARVSSALVVPVTALLARSGGGYAVEILGAGAHNHLVSVSLGLFDDAEGLVQVIASRLATGQKVVVPSS